MSLSVIVLGATGLVGRTMLQVLAERAMSIRELRPLASDKGGLRTVEFGGRSLPVQPVSEAAFEGADLALFACSNTVSQQWAPVARAAGVTVVDNSSAYRYDDRVPLVVPEVNGGLLDAAPTLVANPNCSTIAIAVALAPLSLAVGLERVVISTYQAVSGAGSEALEELERGIRMGLDGPPPDRGDGGPSYAYNVLPHIDRFEENGYCREEMKVVWETRKILDLPQLPVSATSVRVPVRVGHSAAINVTLAKPLSPDEARALWAGSPGLTVVDDPLLGRYPTPLLAVGRDDVLVGRTRRDLSHPRGLEFFIASDNLRKGAATNAVQIAERLIAAGCGAHPEAPPEVSPPAWRAGAR
jgi:aspartate-semialdehyde dehydrogenase